jgi:hypothetical protein
MYSTFVLFVNQHFPGLHASGTHCILVVAGTKLFSNKISILQMSTKRKDTPLFYVALYFCHIYMRIIKRYPGLDYVTVYEFKLQKWSPACSKQQRCVCWASQRYLPAGSRFTQGQSSVLRCGIAYFSSLVIVPCLEFRRSWNKRHHVLLSQVSTVSIPQYDRPLCRKGNLLCNNSHIYDLVEFFPSLRWSWSGRSLLRINGFMDFVHRLEFQITRKHSVSETAVVLVSRWGEGDTCCVGRWERANLDH